MSHTYTHDVLFDMTPLDTPNLFRGIGRYVRGLAHALHSLTEEERHGLRIAGLTSHLPTSHSVVDETLSYDGDPALNPTGKDYLRYMRQKRMGLPRVWKGTDARLFHMTEPRGTPFGSLPRVVTCYDIIPLLFPRDYLGKAPGAAFVERMRNIVRYRTALRLAALSEATKTDVVNLLGVDPARVDVVYLGVDHDQFNARALLSDDEEVRTVVGNDEPFLLYVGGGDPRKNLTTLVQAYAQSRCAADIPLVIVGTLTETQRASIDEACRATKVGAKVRIVPYVSDTALAALYRRCTVHIFPSLYEGFGLPALEAIACGAPTLTTTRSSIPEVVGDAAVLVDGEDAREMAEALDRLAADQSARDSLRQRGPEQASRFTWRACALGTVKSYVRALDGHR